MRARKPNYARPEPDEFFALGEDLLDDLENPPTFEALVEAIDHLFECNQLGARAAFLTAVAARRVWVVQRQHDEIREIYVRWALGREKSWF
jgi:hypothetical protein